MIAIVSNLVKALNNYSPIAGEAIHKSVIDLIEENTFVWKADYPIAVVHKDVRIKEPVIISKFEAHNLLDTKGETPTSYNKEALKFLETETPAYIKIVNLMCMEKEDENLPTFEPKRENDYWKKLVNTGNFKAVVEFSFFGEDTDICTIEKVGRDIMRSRKEVYTVRELGFVWVVQVHPLMNLDAIFQLYFGEDYLSLNQDEMKYYIGWSSKLQEVNMRNFVCPPIS